MNGEEKNNEEEKLNNGGEKSESKELLQEEKSEKSENQPLTNSSYCMWTCILSVSSVMMSTGIAVGAMTPSISVLIDFYNQTNYDRHDEYFTGETKTLLISLFISSMMAGGLIGALSIGFMLTKFTRKQSMIIMNITNLIGVFILCIGGWFIPSYECVIIGRFLIGLFSGLGMNLIPIVVAETSNSTRKDFYLSLIGVNLSFGCLFGLLLGFKEALGGEDLWPVLLCLSSLPSLAYLATSYWLPESPSYLLRAGKRTQALELLRSLRKDPKEEELCHELSCVEREQKSSGMLRRVSLMKMFSDGGLRRQLFVVVMVFMQSQLCGINGVGMYTNVIFMETLGFSQDTATLASTIVYSVQFVIALMGSWAVDRYDPKWINVISGSVMSAMLVLLTASMATNPHHVIPALSYVSVAAVTVYAFAWSCGINLTLFPLLAALTTEPTREAAFKFGGGIFWVLSWFVSFIPPYLMKSIGVYANLPWTILNAVFAIYIALCVPRVKGKSPQQIQAKVQGRHLARGSHDLDVIT